MSKLSATCAALFLSALGVSAQETSALAHYVGGGFEDRFLGGTELTLDLSQGVPWRVFTLDNPRRLVLDFREVNWQGADPVVMDQSDRVSELRMGGFRPGWSRMVAVLDEPAKVKSAGVRIDPETAQARLELSLEPTSDEAFAASAGAPTDAGWDEKQLDPTQVAPVEDGTLLVLLDPGHGGIDPGAERGAVKEADLMLLFAHELRDVLLRTGRYRVELTRTTDKFVSLEGRIALAHDLGADLLISLHADALSEGIAHGAAVYTLADEASDAASQALAERHDRNDLLSGVDLSQSDDRVAQILLGIARLDNTPRSKSLAREVLGGIRNAVGHVHKRPLRQAGFSVLKSADIPSILIELGFLSTDQDLQNLQDPIWRAGMAAGIRDGIEAWAIEDEALSRLRRQ